MYQGTITRQMKLVKKDVYKKLLTRRDFEYKISKLRNAKPSQKPTICAELCDMFSVHGVTCEPEQDPSYYEALISKAKLPEFRDAEETILGIMYDNFENYPTPSEYMLRMVNRLSDPEDGWHEDSLRLRILKQFIKYLNCCVYEKADGRIKSVYGWEKVIKAYAKKHGARRIQNVSDAVSYIDEEIFEEYSEEVRKCQQELNERQQDEQLVELRKAVSNLKKLLKQNKGNEEELRKIKEELEKKSTELKEAEKPVGSAKERLKKARKDYGIVRLADDLSKGIFKTGGTTKRDLYLFAIAFNMTYSTNRNAGPLETTQLFDYERDIEKNLFEDYYTNNLMRFVTEAYDGNLSAYDLDPYGRGINYKNFAEMVYIYFISKDYEPIEKFRCADEMIERIQLSAKPQMFADKATNPYQLLFTETLLKMDEGKFEKFISSNYECSGQVEFVDEKGKKSKKRISAFEIHIKQNTPFRYYNELIAQIEKNGSGNPSFLRENCNYGLYFADVSSFEKFGTKDFENTLKRMSRNNEQKNQDEKIQKFIKLLNGINMFLGYLFVEEESSLSYDQEHKELSKQTIKKMNIEKSEDMTRTALVVAYYYRYNQLNEQRGECKSFVDVMDDYMDTTTGLNGMLEASGYQPINDRNIFDLAVIFSSYAYLTR